MWSTDFQQSHSMGKEQSLHQKVLAQMDIQYQKVKLDPYLTPFTKINQS